MHKGCGVLFRGVYIHFRPLLGNKARYEGFHRYVIIFHCGTSRYVSGKNICYYLKDQRACRDLDLSIYPSRRCASTPMGSN